MKTEATVKCPICGKPYKVYAFYAGDPTACSDCVRKADKNSIKYAQMERRKHER
jgi:endogenous inhibitor of DNA gyrase (YacG/DUF329 family)